MKAIKAIAKAIHEEIYARIDRFASEQEIAEIILKSLRQSDAQVVPNRMAVILTELRQTFAAEDWNE